MRFYALGARWACRLRRSDLELFPKRYPGLRTMEFRASLEIGAQQFALWLAAVLRRRGVPLPIERWRGRYPGSPPGWTPSAAISAACW